ncbi:MAG: helix-turn-helix domain-containing protein [Planctomycetes bacterium]|nr:helix-turn-helix domain-containing protein [Planctomycetota bacterium]
MKDFAHWLRVFREKSGLNQKELAERVGSTGSYISMLESRKKPPPSDEVVRRLASALGVEENLLLEFAHLERTPYDIKEQFEVLRGRVERETGLSRWATGPFREKIIPLLLYQVACPPPYLAPTEEASAPPPPLRKFHRRVLALARSAGDFARFANEVASLLEGLDEEALSALQDWLPRIWQPSGAAPRPAAPAISRLPILIEVPWEPVEHAAVSSGGWKEVPASLWAPGRYYLIASGTAMYPRIEEGDYVIVDETMPPENGDLVAVIHAGQGQILRYIESGDQVEFAPANPQFPPIRAPRASVGKPGGPTIRGVVVEIQRETK